MMLLVNSSSSSCSFNGTHPTPYTGELSLDSELETHTVLGIIDMLHVASLVLLILVLFIYKWLSSARIKTGYKSANTSSEMDKVKVAAAVTVSLA